MKTLSVLRVAAVTVMAAACLLLVFCEINEEQPFFRFSLLLLATKLGGFACGYACYRMVQLWKNDAYISKILEMCEEE